MSNVGDFEACVHQPDGGRLGGGGRCDGCSAPGASTPPEKVNWKRKKERKGAQKQKQNTDVQAALVICRLYKFVHLQKAEMLQK